MIELIYPTLDLFLYDLRDGLGQSEEEIKQNRKSFKERLPQTVDKELFDRLDERDFEAEYVELLGDKRTEPLPSDWLIKDGYYYPVRLSDTYGLLIDRSLKDQKPDFDLKELKVLFQGKTGTIGQTWMFSAALPYYLDEDREAIAKDCYRNLMPDSCWKDNKIGQSNFRGVTIFELWGYNSINQTNIHEKNHVIIALYPDQQTVEKAAEFYPDWMRLFCYRHKILWAYGQSRELKKKLKKDYSEIENCRKEISQHSSQQLNCQKIQETLDKAWNILASYATELNQLDDQAHTIEINLHNYQKRLSRIEEKTGQGLNFLESFSNDVREKYLLQVQKDSANLAPGLRLLEDLIGYIRARVEIEEEKRDRNFQNVIEVVGLTWATAGVVSSIPWLPPEKKAALEHPVGKFLNNQWGVPGDFVAPAATAIFSFGAALLVCLLTTTWIRLRQSR